MCNKCLHLILRTADPVDVLVERKQELLPVDSPYFNGLVVRGCNQSLSITRKVYTAHGGSVSSEYCGLSLPVNTQKPTTKMLMITIKNQWVLHNVCFLLTV